MALRAARALTWLPVAVAADAVLGGPARAAGGGMAPALADGDVVLVDRLAVRLFTYERGDVVQLRSPDDPAALLTRRLVALEGDWVAPAAGSFVRPTEEVPRGHCWLAADDGGRDAAAAPPPRP